MSKLNKNSNFYILGYAILLTIVLGTLLPTVAGALKSKIVSNKAFEKKKFILTAGLGHDEVAKMTDDQINNLFDNSVESQVINAQGDRVNKNVASVIVAKEYKLDKELRALPIYIITSENEKSFVFPMHGYGLWDEIWGYVALEKDGETIKAVVFDHKGETPGLGARISSEEIQKRFSGKSIFDETKNLVSVSMQKGEGNDYSDKKNEVDGMSGATITGVGLNNMLKEYFSLYKKYISTISK